MFLVYELLYKGQESLLRLSEQNRNVEQVRVCALIKKGGGKQKCLEEVRSLQYCHSSVPHGTEHTGGNQLLPQS